jgi:hypothetical protein
MPSRAGAERSYAVHRQHPNPAEPITRETLAAAAGSADQGLQPSAHKMAFVGGHDER